jgi:hypothetical protein
VNRENATAIKGMQKFRGNTDGMKGHVYQCHSETIDKQQFLKTNSILEEHINKTFTFPADIAPVCKAGFVIPTIVQPPNLTEEEYKTDMGKKMIWEIEIKTFMKRRDMQESNKRAVYAIIWGQSSPMMQSKIESLDAHKIKSEACDCVWLLQEIQGVTHKFEGTRNIFLSLDDAWSRYYTYHQSSNQTLHDYLKDFQAIVQVLEHYGGGIGTEKPLQDAVRAGVTNSAPKGTSPTELEAMVAPATKNKWMAMGFIKRADRKVYGGLCSELENNYTRGHDQYPEDLTSAYGLLLNYKAPPPTRFNKQEEQINEEGMGLSFLQNKSSVPGTDGVIHEKVKCYNCELYGHYASSCPKVETNTQLLQTDNQAGVQLLQREEHGYESDNSDQTGFTFVTEGITLHQGRKQDNTIPDTWILLDSESTCSIFRNPKLVTNIRAAEGNMTVLTNGGPQVSTLVATVANFGEVWFNPKSLANILSMAQVRKKCRITMDSDIEAAMLVHRKDGSIIKFVEFSNGLYYFDTKEEQQNKKNKVSDNYLFVNTVAANKSAYTREEVEAADRARALYRKLGRPSEVFFQHLLQNNLIRNCPVTVDDAKRALNIYGPDIATLKGKTVKKQNEGTDGVRPIVVPTPIMDKYSHLRLFADIFYVNGNLFLHTISEFIKFRTVAPLNNRTKQTILTAISSVIRLYDKRGFTVTRVEADNEFAPLVHDLLPTQCNIAAADDHVAEVERSIRTIKERVRSILQGLPFKRVPKLIIRAAVAQVHTSLNQFPIPNSASSTISPLTIMTGNPLPDYHDLRIEFGSYAQIFKGNDPTNNMDTCTTGAITLNPTGNTQGGVYFLSLSTGRRLTRQQWTPLPMPNGVVTRVEELAIIDQQPIMAQGAANFEWAPGVPINDNVPPVVINHYPFDDEAPPPVFVVPAPDDNDPDHESDQDESDQNESDQDESEQDHENESTSDDDPGHDSEEPDPDLLTTGHIPPPITAEEAAEYPNDITPDDTNNTPEPEAARGGYQLRPNRKRDYSHRFDHNQFLQTKRTQSKKKQNQQNSKHTNAQERPKANNLSNAIETFYETRSKTKLMRTITGFIMTQMTAKAGIKKTWRSSS